MVLGEIMSAHAPVAGNTASASTWICQQQSHQLSSFSRKMLVQKILKLALYFFSIPDVMIGLWVQETE
jgi:hypothetical protein